MKSAVVILYWC